jgi:hypothetical protein
MNCKIGLFGPIAHTLLKLNDTKLLIDDNCDVVRPVPTVPAAIAVPVASSDPLIDEL